VGEDECGYRDYRERAVKGERNAMRKKLTSIKIGRYGKKKVRTTRDRKTRWRGTGDKRWGKGSLGVVERGGGETLPVET